MLNLFASLLIASTTGCIGQVTTTLQSIEVEVVQPIVEVTAYTLSEDETDDTPCIGAGNHNLCELRKKTKVCASNMFPLHTKIYIETIGECEVLDKMNKRYKNRIDVLLDTKKQAEQFGVKKLKYKVYDK